MKSSAQETLMTLWEPLLWVCFAVLKLLPRQCTNKHLVKSCIRSQSHVFTHGQVLDLQHAAAVVTLPFRPKTHIFHFSLGTSIIVLLYVSGTSIIVILYVQTQPCGHQCCPLAMCLRYFGW